MGETKIKDPEIEKWLFEVAECSARYGTGSKRLADVLNERFGTSTKLFEETEQYLWKAVQNQELCTRENGPIRFDRLAKCSDATWDHSIDLVFMPASFGATCVGPWHRHPRGEIGLVMGKNHDLRFDSFRRGWYVYPPNHKHAPTAKNADCLVLYLLPGGEIDFEVSSDQP